MKITRQLLAAAAAAIAATASALSISADTESLTLYTLGFKDMKLGQYGLKDLTGSYLVHSAEKVCHGAPGVTLRFRNTAANERSFLLNGSMELASNVQKEFTIQPGGTTEFTIFFSLATKSIHSSYYNAGFAIWETTPKSNSSRTATDMQLDGLGEFSPSDGSVTSALLSEGIDAKKLVDDLSKALNSTNYLQLHVDYHHAREPSKSEPAQYYLSARQSTLSAANWPRDWRCYSTYDAVIVTRAEYGKLNSEAKSALDVYRQLGGAVIVTEGANGFAHLAEAERSLKTIDDSREALMGDLNIFNYFYSYNYYTGKDEFKDIQRIPLEVKATIPVKALLAVLALFAVVIVPLVIFRSVKSNKRTRLIVLLPGSAALFAVVIAILAFAFFGTTPSTRLQSVTILDQSAKKALTRGQFAVFSPVSLDGRISFPLDSAFMCRTRATALGTAPTTYISDAQRLQGPWVKPLVTEFFDFTRACERPERLDFRVSPSGDVTVANLLGARVAWGQANIGGRLWAFGDVPPGGEAPARKVGQAPADAVATVYPFTDKTSFGRDWKACIDFVTNRLDKIPAGEYVVEVDGSPFFQNPVDGKSSTSAAGLVFGKFKEVSE